MLRATAQLYGVEPLALLRSQDAPDLLSQQEVADTIAYCCSVEGAAVNGMVVPVPSGAA